MMFHTHYIICYNLHACSTMYTSHMLQWYHYQRQKLLYDESWIIDFDKIEREVGYRGEFIKNCL